MKYMNPQSLPRHCTLEVCQNCQSHKNKPSRCHWRELGTGGPAFVGRKNPACAEFLNKHTGMTVQGGVIVCKPGTTLDIETGKFSY